MMSLTTPVAAPAFRSSEHRRQDYEHNNVDAYRDNHQNGQHDKEDQRGAQKAAGASNFRRLGGEGLRRTRRRS